MRWDDKPLVQLPVVLELIKRAYYNSISAKGGPRAPRSAVHQLTYTEVASLVAKKYANQPNAHMPGLAAIKLMYTQSQWWISMASESWRDIGSILNHRVWGWSTLE